MNLNQIENDNYEELGAERNAKEPKRIQSESEKREQAISFARSAREFRDDKSKIKFYDDEAGLSKMEREILDRDTDYKRDENDIFW